MTVYMLLGVLIRSTCHYYRYRAVSSGPAVTAGTAAFNPEARRRRAQNDL